MKKCKFSLESTAIGTQKQTLFKAWTVTMHILNDCVNESSDPIQHHMSGPSSKVGSNDE